MSARLRTVKTRPLKGSTIRDILRNHPEAKQKLEEQLEEALEKEIETKASLPPPTEPLVLKSEAEYDTLHPEETIRDMVRFLKSAKERYEENQRLMDMYALETSDLWHYAEMHKDLNAREGFAFYKKTRESCRGRRTCKNEMELLQPLVDYLTEHPEILNDLPRIQGLCGKAKQRISLRQYAMRTDVIS